MFVAHKQTNKQTDRQTTNRQTFKVAPPTNPRGGYSGPISKNIILFSHCPRCQRDEWHHGSHPADPFRPWPTAPPRPHARHAPYDGMGGVIRCYRTPPGQPAIGGSTSTHILLLNRPGARGGAILVCTGRPRKACKHRMQDGMKCAARAHARDVAWEVG